MVYRRMIDFMVASNYVRGVIRQKSVLAMASQERFEWRYMNIQLYATGYPNLTDL